MKEIPDIARITNIKTGDDPIYFHLRSGDMDFSLPLTDVLFCFKYAETKEMIPPIPEQYWMDFYERFSDLPKAFLKSADEAFFLYDVIPGDNDDYFYFTLQLAPYKSIIGLSHILMCIKLAEEEGNIPLLPREYWYKLEHFYPELEEMRVFGFHEEI